MARRRRRSLGYQPTILKRTPTFVYIVLALLCVGGLFYSKQNLVKPISGRVVDAYSGMPLPGVDVILNNDKPLAHTAGISDTFKSSTDNAGQFTFPQATDKYTLSAQFINYTAVNLQQSGVYSSELKLTPTLLQGQVKDQTGRSLSQALVTLTPKTGQPATTTTDTGGMFSFKNAPDSGTVSAHAPGYQASAVSFSRSVQVSLTLQSFKVEAAYVAPADIAGPSTFQTVMGALYPTDLTAVVVDIKDESGKVLYDSKVPEAASAIAGDDKRIPDMAAMLKTFKDHKLYTIARIVCFQDPVLTDLKPDWTLKSLSTGKPWADTAGYNWINPYNQDAWNYYLGLAQEAAAAGFDEVDFDGLHFPVLGDLKDINYGQTSDETSRKTAINNFLIEARKRLAPLGVYTSVTVLGSALVESGDLGIGMDVSAMAPNVDYISPRIYPDEWGAGAFGIDQPVAKPYDLVQQSLLSARSRLGDRLKQVRPWLEDFNPPPPTGNPPPPVVTYGESQIRDEIRAVDEIQTTDAAGWILYNPNSHYNTAAFTPKS